MRGTPPASDDYRFDAICAITMNESPFYGSANYFGSGVLIAPNVVLTAKHLASQIEPEREWIVSFRRKTDDSVGTINPGGTSTLHSVVVDHIVKHPSKDLMLMYLVSNVSHITPMAYDLDALGVAYGDSVYVAGWGSESGTFGNVSTSRRLTYGSTARDFLQLSDYTSAAVSLMPAGYSTDANCPTCPVTINLYDSGSPIMRMDSEEPVVMGIASFIMNDRPYHVMLTGLTDDVADDATFMANLSSSPDGNGEFKFVSARPQSFIGAVEMASKASLSNAASAFHSSTPVPLNMSETVNASAPFNHFDNAADYTSISNSSNTNGSCSGGSYESGSLGYTQFSSDGDDELIDTTYTLNRYHTGLIDKCDSSMKMYSTAVSGNVTIGTVAARVIHAFDWDYSRLNGGVQFKLVSPPGMVGRISFLGDENIDGTFERSEAQYDYPLVYDPILDEEVEQLNGDGNHEMTLNVYCLDPGTRYRVMVEFFIGGGPSLTYQSLGCSFGDDFSKTNEAWGNFTAIPFGTTAP